MPEVSDEYIAFMTAQGDAFVAPPSGGIVEPGSLADHLIGPVVPAHVFNGDPEKGIKADYRFAAYADVKLNRIEHCMFYYAGAGPEDPMWPRPKVKLSPEDFADRWDYRTLPPAPNLYWACVNLWRRIRTRIIEALPAPCRRYVC